VPHEARVECVVPDLLHVIPVVDNAMLNRVLQCQDTSFGLSFITHIGILLAHADHDTGVARPAYNAGKDSSWCIVTSETRLFASGVRRSSVQWKPGVREQ
jgi:hypothetical protein